MPRKKTGLPPGTPVYTGVQQDTEVSLTCCRYNEAEVEEQEVGSEEFVAASHSFVTWYDLRGLHDIDTVQALAQTYNIHPLGLEDLLDVNQRPKFDEYENGIILLLKALSIDKKTLRLRAEHIGIFLGKNVVITFQEDTDDESDDFAAVRKRIHEGRGRIRQRGTDYLAYALIDVLADNYYLILDQIGDINQDLEEEIMGGEPDEDIKLRIYRLKKQMLLLRKSISPLREAISRFSKSDHEVIQEGTEVFLRDLYDHTIQVMDTVDSYRDTLSGLYDLYISEISFRMNNVMQILTIISALFIPTTFLAGIYGMNFEYIPELGWHYSYYVFWVVLLAIFIGGLVFFKKRKWL